VYPLSDNGQLHSPKLFRQYQQTTASCYFSDVLLTVWRCSVTCF